MLKFHRYAISTQRIFQKYPNTEIRQPIRKYMTCNPLRYGDLRKYKMESGFEEPIRSSFSRTPRKMSRDNSNGQFRTRTHSIASTGSNGENGINGIKSVKSTSLYKTELCRSFEDTGMCRYGKKCQFAHSRKELRVLARHPKYKTDMSKSYHSTGFCPYGTRCHFIHNPEDIEKDSSEEDSVDVKPFEGLKISDTFDPSDWPSKPVRNANSNSNSKFESSKFETKTFNSNSQQSARDESSVKPGISGALKSGLTKNSTFASFNSVGSIKTNSSVESIWSNNNSSSNLYNFDPISNPWSDSYLSPADCDRVYNNDLSLPNDGNWGGLTFSTNQNVPKPSSLGGSDRDSLSPEIAKLPTDLTFSLGPMTSSFNSPVKMTHQLTRPDDITDDSSRLSVFRTLSCSEK
jgi:hypothetical protein